MDLIGQKKMQVKEIGVTHSMKSGRNYPELKYLMQHFHQDWKCEYKRDTDVLSRFATQNPAPVVDKAIEEIREILAHKTPGSRLDTLFLDEWHVEPPYHSAEEVVPWLKKAAEVLIGRKGTAEKAHSTLDRDRGSKVGSYPGLYLLMCQFDADWKVVFRTEDNVLKHFRKANSRKDVEACVGDIKRILNAGYTDQELDHFLRNGLGGRPPYEEASKVRDWLNHILNVYRNIKPGMWK